MNEPSIPICFFIHDRRKIEDHHEFLTFAFNRLKFNANIPLVSDRKASFLNFFKSNASTENNHFVCTNHVLSDVECWVRANLGGSEVDFYDKQVKRLIWSNSLFNYQKRKEKLETDWKPEFLKYFNDNLDEDLQINFKQLDTKNFPVFEKGQITNNISEAFNSAFKRVFEAEKIDRTEQVLVALFVWQVHQLQEFEDAMNEVGDFHMHKHLKHRIKTLDLRYGHIDYETILKDAKATIETGEPQTTESFEENWSESYLAFCVKQMNLIHFIPNPSSQQVSLFQKRNS